MLVRYFFFSAIVAALLIHGSQAEAQYLRDERVMLQMPVDERIPPELKPQPMQFQGFIVKPAVGLESFYDSNVLVEPNGEEADFALRVKPELTLQKLYDNHSFIVGGRASFDRYASVSEENRADYDGFFRGVLGQGGRFQIPYNFELSRENRDRKTPVNRALTREPGYRDRGAAETGFLKTFNRLTLGLIGRYESESFSNERSASTGAPVVFDDLDKDSLRGTLRLRYEFPGETAKTPQHILYADLYNEHQDFKRLSYVGGGYNGDDGDQDIRGFMAGVESDYKGLVFANLGAGYEEREFEDPDLNAVSLVNLKARVDYNILPKLTLNLEGGRSLTQDNGFVQGIKRWYAGAGADYELQHNLYAGISSRYTDFSFIDAARGTEEDLMNELGLRYIHSPHLQSNIQLQYQTREAQDPDYSFDRTIILLGLKRFF